MRAMHNIRADATRAARGGGVSPNRGDNKKRRGCVKSNSLAIFGKAPGEHLSLA